MKLWVVSSLYAFIYFFMHSEFFFLLISFDFGSGLISQYSNPRSRESHHTHVHVTKAFSTEKHIQDRTVWSQKCQKEGQLTFSRRHLGKCVACYIFCACNIYVNIILKYITYKICNIFCYILQAPAHLIQ